MNPCEICGDRILHYPGTCDRCQTERRHTAETQWMPAYEAVTEAKNKASRPHAKGVHGRPAPGLATARQTKLLRNLEKTLGIAHNGSYNKAELAARIAKLTALLETRKTTTA